jgi:type VI protein secretion system component Hcp
MPEFLNIEGIRGDASEAKHKGEIELTSVGFLGGSPGSAIAPSNLKLRDLGVTKNPDSASTALHKAALSGQVFPKMTIDLVRPRGTSRLTLSMASIGSMELDQQGNESFNLTFEWLSIKQV